jgi:hypothetical protein
MLFPASKPRVSLPSSSCFPLHIFLSSPPPNTSKPYLMQGLVCLGAVASLQIHCVPWTAIWRREGKRTACMRCLELDLLKLSLDLSVSVLLINCELLFHALVWFHLVTISLSSFGIDLFKGFKFLQEKDIGCLCLFTCSWIFLLQGSVFWSRTDRQRCQAIFNDTDARRHSFWKRYVIKVWSFSLQTYRAQKHHYYCLMISRFQLNSYLKQYDQNS